MCYAWTEGEPSVRYWTRGRTPPGDITAEAQLTVTNAVFKATEDINNAADIPYKELRLPEGDVWTSATVQLRLVDPNPWGEGSSASPASVLQNA